MDNKCQSSTKECWYPTEECPDEPVSGPLGYAIQKYAGGPYQYYWDHRSDKKVGSDGRRLEYFPHGEEDLGTPIWAQGPSGTWYSGLLPAKDDLFEIVCGGLVDESLKQFPCIDWQGWDVIGSDFNRDTWCEPKNPGPGDLVICNGSPGRIDQ